MCSKAIAMLREFDRARIQPEQADHLEFLREQGLVGPDVRVGTGGALGRLMQVSLTRIMNASGDGEAGVDEALPENAKDIDNTRLAVLAHALVRDVTCLVVKQGGVFIVDAQGNEELMTELPPPPTSCDVDSDAEKEEDEKQRSESLALSKAIEMLDRSRGLDKPIIVFGFQRVLRVTSVRSLYRVITHELMCMTPGQTAANWVQLSMRGAGATVAARLANGFRNVCILCPESDYKLVESSDKFTEEVMRFAGTGEMSGLHAFSSANYSSSCAAAVTTERALARNDMPRGKVKVGDKTRLVLRREEEARKERLLMRASREDEEDGEDGDEEDELLADGEGEEVAGEHLSDVEETEPDAKVFRGMVPATIPLGLDDRAKILHDCDISSRSQLATIVKDAAVSKSAASSTSALSAFWTARPRGPRRTWRTSRRLRASTGRFSPTA